MNFLQNHNGTVFQNWDLRTNQVVRQTFLNQFFPVLVSKVFPNSARSLYSSVLESDDVGVRNLGPLGNFSKTKSCDGVKRLFRLIAGGTTYATSPVFPDFITTENKAKFLIFDQTNQLYLTLNYDSLGSEYKKIMFVPNRPVYILIHGWMDRYYPGCWMDVS